MLSEIGLYGLGTMGSALALNLAEKGFRVGVSNRDPGEIADFLTRAGPLADRIDPQPGLAGFVGALKRPRLILFMIPSGAPLDKMIATIAPHLEPGDTLIDGGNANFHDTRRRVDSLARKGIEFVGMGVSGGEMGARHGPSMMLGGTPTTWERLRPILTRIAADYQGVPCVAHVGADGAGHFVKTVHNGIEYADMQIIAEVHALMDAGEGRGPAEIAEVFEGWNAGPLASYLVEITARILRARDTLSGAPMLEMIRDSAGQKGTGRWTVIEAQQMGQSATIVEAAVAARSWSAEARLRRHAETLHGNARDAVSLTDDTLADAFMAARILAHAQGFRILHSGARNFEWQTDLARIAEIWRAGCIIRSALLDDIATALHDAPPEGELLLAPVLARRLAATVPALRETVAAAVASGHGVPALTSALQWFDVMRQGRGPTALIQAQRDFFGRHGFERVDRDGSHHGPWDETSEV